MVAKVVSKKILKQISASHINIANLVRSTLVLIGATHHRKKRTEYGHPKGVRDVI
jgi:hypothetical protein